MDDPKKPYKAIMAAVVAAGSALLAFSDTIPQWAVIVTVVVIAGLCTYLVPNPKV